MKTDLERLGKELEATKKENEALKKELSAIERQLTRWKNMSAKELIDQALQKGATSAMLLGTQNDQTIIDYLRAKQHKVGIDESLKAASDEQVENELSRRGKLHPALEDHSISDLESCLKSKGWKASKEEVKIELKIRAVDEEFFEEVNKIQDECEQGLDRIRSAEVKNGIFENKETRKRDKERLRRRKLAEAPHRQARRKRVPEKPEAY